MDTVRIRTRVVFIDTLVKDARTNEPVRDLTGEEFKVLDDGQPRKLSYFTRDGDSRRPLAMLLFIDIWSVYGRSILKSANALRLLAFALNKLAPEDEVAVMTTWIEDGGALSGPVTKCRMIEGFTRDRAKTKAALLSIPELMKEQERLLDDLAARRSRDAGDMRLDLYWKLAEVGDEVIPLAARFPNSQFVVVGLTDDLFELKKGEREETIKRALEAGVTFNGLVFKKSFGTKFLIGTISKITMSPRGLSVHAADEIAKETGGEVASVGRAEDLGRGMERFISSLMARYSLGFTLGEEERGQGRLHQLEVKVSARDPEGRTRKLIVTARRGYYLPETAEAPAVK